MTWKTHAVVGANAVWLTAAFGVFDSTLLILLPAAVIASLLPDIDAAGGNAKINYLPGPGKVFNIVRGNFYGKYLYHRGIMHSLFVTLIFFVVILIATQNRWPLLPPIFALAYLSHLVVDGFNMSGVSYLSPFVLRKYALLPKFLRTPVKGTTDSMLFFLGALGLLLYLFIFCVQFYGIAF